MERVDKSYSPTRAAEVSWQPDSSWGVAWGGVILQEFEGQGSQQQAHQLSHTFICVDNSSSNYTKHEQEEEKNNDRGGIIQAEKEQEKRKPEVLKVKVGIGIGIGMIR